MNNQDIVFRFPWWEIAIPFLITLGLIAIAVRLLRSPQLKAVAALPLLAALCSGGIFAPALAFDRLRVGPTRIEQVTGFWFAPTTKGFVYAETESVRITRKPEGPKRQMQTIWEVRGKDGRVSDLVTSDLWRKYSGQIVSLLEARGVRFER